MERIESSVTRAQQDEVRTLQTMLSAIAGQRAERDAQDLGSFDVDADSDCQSDWADDALEGAVVTSQGAARADARTHVSNFAVRASAEEQRDVTNVRRPGATDATARRMERAVVPLPERTAVLASGVARRAPPPPPPPPAMHEYIVPTRREVGPPRRSGRRWQP